jgi:hypothetical protein
MHVVDKCILCGSETRKSPAILMPFIVERIFGWKPVIIDDSWQLKTIKNGNAYSICNSLYCKNCDFLFSDIRFDKEELEKLYLDYRGESYTNLRDYYEPGYSQVNDKAKIQNDYLGEIESMILPLLPSKEPVVLDWGGIQG